MAMHYCLRFPLPETRLLHTDAACSGGSSCATALFSASYSQPVSVSATSSFKLGAFRISNAPLSHGSHAEDSYSLRGEEERGGGGGDEDAQVRADRRLALTMISGVLAAGLASNSGPALAVKQILLAGRVPGLSAPDENGYRTYRRPDAKSGGHGVGWSPIIPYSFKVTDEWEEVPVSIADLGGTEIDLRFSSKQEGNISVVVAPVLRFASDLGDSAKIEQIGPPEKVIDAFGPELVGQNVEGQVQDMDVSEHDGRKYYLYELKSPHVLITATAAGNRLYLMTVGGNARQWKKYGEGLRQIAESFRVG